MGRTSVQWFLLLLNVLIANNFLSCKHTMHTYYVCVGNELVRSQLQLQIEPILRSKNDVVVLLDIVRFSLFH